MINSMNSPGRSDSTIKILLVEDNPDDVELTIAAMKEAKIKNVVFTVEDGVEALEFLHRQGEYENAPRPDLILLDLNLPRKNGRQVLAEIKTDESLRRIPVVVLTMSRDDKDILQAYDLHANCYITKPVDLDQFTTIVKSIDSFWFSIVKLPEV